MVLFSDESESDKDSDGSESETETETNSNLNRSMRSRRILSDEDKKPLGTLPAPPVPGPGSKTRSARKCKTDEEEEEGDKKEKEDEEEKKKLPSQSQEAERKSLRLSQRKKQEAEHDKRLGPESDSDSENETEEAKVLEIIEPLDDVYEFKEPEPFNFKQKKTISPLSSGSGGKGKKNIGLFEDYDNMEEDSEDPISAAIQRVMVTCNDSQVEDMDLLDSNSSDSDLSNDSSNMCEMMKKRLQSEINTYEGPKSKLKAGTPSSSMRTRRSSESKSKAEDKTLQRLKVEKVTDDTIVEVKQEQDNSTPPRVKKSDGETTPKTKKTDSDGFSKLKKSDPECSTTKTKKPELDNGSGFKVKKSEDRERSSSESHIKVSKKSEMNESSMKTRLKSESRCNSPGSKTRSKTEQLKEEEEGKTGIATKKTAEPDCMKKQQPTKSCENSKSLTAELLPFPKAVISPSLLLPTKPSPLKNEPQTPETIDEGKEQDPMSFKVKPKVLPVTGSSKIIPLLSSPCKSTSITPLSSKVTSPSSISSLADMKSKSLPPKSHIDFSVQTEAHDLEDTEKPSNTSPSLLPKLQKIESTSSTVTEAKSTDIPVLQRIETVLPKTPIKRETIDPSKIDLIKVSPNMPQLEKIDPMNMDKKDPSAAMTPVKTEDAESREDSKFPPFKFDDVTETPEKVFLPAVDQESTGTPIKLDKIEFKMKPKAPSPSGFLKAERARKLVRQRIGEPSDKTITREKKSPQPVVKKYGSSPNESIVSNMKPDGENKDSTLVPSSKSKDSTATSQSTHRDGSPVSFINKSRDSSPISSAKLKDASLGKIKDSVSESNKSKDNLTNISSKTKDVPTTVPIKPKDTLTTVSSKIKDNAGVSSKTKDAPNSTLSKLRDSPTLLSNKPKDIPIPLPSKANEVPSPQSSKIKDTSPITSNKEKDNLIVSNKIKDAPTILPTLSKGKDDLFSQSKHKDSSQLFKCKDIALNIPSKIKDVSPSKNKDAMMLLNIRRDVNRPESPIKNKANTTVLSAKMKDAPLRQSGVIIDKSINITPITKDTLSVSGTSEPDTDVSAEEKKDAENEKEKDEAKAETSKTETPATKDNDDKEETKKPSTTTKQTIESPEKFTVESKSKELEAKKSEVEKKGEDLEENEDLQKKDEKSKELSSVFEFDETLEDEMIDIESDSYLITSKRKLACLVESPSSESVSSKMQKLNELEKLKQKLFMDCSGESEDLEEKVETKEKEETRGGEKEKQEDEKGAEDVDESRVSTMTFLKLTNITLLQTS